jgi:putative membrane-bound dehydrogenase-like protein
MAVTSGFFQKGKFMSLRPRSTLVLGWLGITLCGVVIGAVAAEKPASIAIFDGKTLDGWEGDTKHWRVENGAIVGEIPQGTTLDKNTWLVWRGGELRDFDLRLQFKLTGEPAANSGIQVRSRAPDFKKVSGYQADLDLGAKWLGRIYEEHGRAMLVERGTRVLIDRDGKPTVQAFAPAKHYAVLFRHDAWNDYRIVGIGERLAVFVNGTLFSELVDQQEGVSARAGLLALQLHSGPATRIEFRDIRLEQLAADDSRLGGDPFKNRTQEPTAAVASSSAKVEADVGVLPTDAEGKPLNMSFETGTLADWKATGKAFEGQPVSKPALIPRGAAQYGIDSGRFLIAGFEVVKDGAKGTLTSKSFKVTHPYASFLVGGGKSPQTRVEVFQPAADGGKEKVLFKAMGQLHGAMRRVVVDLRAVQGQTIAVRVVDDATGPWGHINFDDFRFHKHPPAVPPSTGPMVHRGGRSIFNPVLRHLVPNPVAADPAKRGTETVAKMFVPEGFEVDVVVAEPQIHQPIAFTFDTRGRLWVVEAHSYPQKRPDGEGLDKIVIFSDDDGDGSFENRKVFAEKLNLVSGLAVGHGGVWVGAAPELLFFPDRDGDDRPDGEPVVLLDGFGFGDTHETPNSFLWGPDGWLYGNQGVFNSSRVGKPGAAPEERLALRAGVWRYHPIRHVFEIFASGGSNQWGLDYDEHGQLFMTHCRSKWGQGGTTHVIQGGHFWTQTNSGYAPFISNAAPAGMPHMVNYLLASARYDHGEGGAGKPGSNDVYGGHSHVGTLIYQGDNWPAKYYGHLFTHNLHGHQINQQVNIREGGGYNTLHAGEDMLFCAEPQFIGVDLQCGPDGAVYMSDWHDKRLCHSPHLEQWDRGNGRIYRMKYSDGWRSVAVNYSKATDLELVEAQRHSNDWHARAARLVLAERGAAKTLSSQAIAALHEMAGSEKDASRRLRAIFALHGAGALDLETATRMLQDTSEYVRAWGVQLGLESHGDSFVEPVLDLAKRDSSAFVRRSCASAAQRMPSDAAWTMIEILAAQPENAADRELPKLLWYALAQRMPDSLSRAMTIAGTTRIQSLADSVVWYAARLSDQGRDAIVKEIMTAPPEAQGRLLVLFDAGVRGQRGLKQPAEWAQLVAKVDGSSHGAARGAIESLGAAFGDAGLYQKMRGVLGDPKANVQAKLHALSVLDGDSSPQNLPVLLALLDHPRLVQQILPQLKRYRDSSVATALIQRLPKWDGNVAPLAVEVLCNRPTWAGALLDSIGAGSVDKKVLTAFDVRQIASLGDDALNERITKQWGQFRQSPAEQKAEMVRLVKAYSEAPVWAFDAKAGQAHFTKLCATCHQPASGQAALAPSLEGTAAKGINYIVENIVDPNAVVGKDFETRVVITDEGRVINGLVVDENETAITLRTATSTETVARSEIDEMVTSPNSLMPEGLLKTLSEREQIELLKYLMTR